MDTADGASRPVRFEATGKRAPGFTWSDGDGERRFAPALAHDGFEARELAFTHDGVRLAGTLFSPRHAPARAAAVLIHGSGTSDRDNYWYMSIVHALAGRGIAVLLPDKRGSGRSGGDWRTASFDVLAGDAAAAVRAVRDAVGPADVSIGVIGLSQGGRVAACPFTRTFRARSPATIPRRWCKRRWRTQFHSRHAAPPPLLREAVRAPRTRYL